QGVFEDAALYIVIMYAIDLDLAIDPFESIGTVVIRQGGQGNFDGDQLGFVVIVPVETGFQFGLGLLFPVCGEELVSVPVEEENSHEQYGQQALQSATN